MALYHNQRAEDEADAARVQFADSPDVLGAMGSYYGTNLKDTVNIHDDDSSYKMVAKEGVDAVASGNDIYFGQGAYDMGNRDSRGLLAHEAAHVIQQGGLLGMNQNSPYGARQGGILGSIGNFLATGAVSLVSALGGALAGLFWRSKIGGDSIKRDTKFPKGRSFVLSIKDHKQTGIRYHLNPFNIHNGFIKLEDGLTTYAGDGEAGASSYGTFSTFKRWMTAPDIGVQYDFRDSQGLRDSAEKSFNNASQYVGTLKHRLLSSTIIGSFIYSLINWNFHYLRRAWPVRIVTGIVRQIGTWGVGLWQALKGIAGKITGKEHLKENAAKWWNKNAGLFFLPFIGDRVHNFIRWARKRLTKGNINKNVIIQERAQDDSSEAIKDFIEIQKDTDYHVEEPDVPVGGSLSHIPTDESLGMPAELTPINIGQNQTPKLEDEAEDEGDPNEIIEGEPTAADLAKVELPDEAKSELIGGMFENGMINELGDNEKNEMLKDLSSDDRTLGMLVNELTPEEKQFFEHNDYQDLKDKSKGEENEPEEIELNDEDISDDLNAMPSDGQQPLPMMPPVAGPNTSTGPVTFRNAEEVLDDGWQNRSNLFEKKNESFDNVLLNTEHLGNNIVDKLRTLQIATESGNKLDAGHLDIYEAVLAAVNKLDDSIDDIRTAKVWAMRFLRCVNSKRDENQAA